MNPIEKYNLNELETKAYKVCLIWEEKAVKFFPNYSHTKMRAGDPRKSLIFKIAYKLCREKTGLLFELDYPLYIHAQLDILKHLTNSGIHPLISPNCLVGDKAWKRWKLWKSKYDKIKESKSVPFKVTNLKILEAFDQTKEFITKHIGLSPSLDDYKKIINDILRWIKLGKISPYYLVLSPFIKFLFEEKINNMNFDIHMYKSCITQELESIFKDKFIWEFQ